MKRRNRSIWEANIWEANSYKSDVFKKPNISHDISSEHVSRPSTLRTNNLKESDQDSDIRTQQPAVGTATWPLESEHMSQNNVKHKRATAPDLAPVEHQRAAGRFRTRNNRPRTIGERALQTEPNAHQGNVEVVGEHQRSIHRQLCLQTRSPLSSSTPPKQTSREEDSDLEPDPC